MLHVATKLPTSTKVAAAATTVAAAAEAATNLRTPGCN